MRMISAAAAKVLSDFGSALALNLLTCIMGGLEEGLFHCLCLSIP